MFHKLTYVIHNTIVVFTCIYILQQMITMTTNSLAIAVQHVASTIRSKSITPRAWTRGKVIGLSIDLSLLSLSSLSVQKRPALDFQALLRAVMATKLSKTAKNELILARNLTAVATRATIVAFATPISHTHSRPLEHCVQREWLRSVMCVKLIHAQLTWERKLMPSYRL